MNLLADGMREGGFFMWPILLAGLIGGALAVERLFYVFFRAGINAPAFMAQIQRAVLDGNIDQAVRMCNVEPSAALPRVLKAGLVRASRPDAEILVVTERGFGKRTPIGDYRLTARGTKGVLTLKTTDKNGRIAAIKEVVDADELMIITRNGTLIRVPVSGVSQLGRATQGVHLIRLEEGDEVAAVAHIVRENELEEVAVAEGVELDATDDAVDDTAEDVDAGIDEPEDEGSGETPEA